MKLIKIFPSGIKSLAHYVHNKGLKFGELVVSSIKRGFNMCLRRTLYIGKPADLPEKGGKLRA